MLTEEQFVAQQRSLGRRIHFRDGVWWVEVYPFYCKPAFEFKIFDPGEAVPARFPSILGYSHQVRTASLGNRTVSFMVLDEPEMRTFSLSALSANKRSVVRRGLKRCSTGVIGDLDPVIERIREINISQAIRQQKRAGAVTPIRRYTKEESEWRSQMRREFALKGREWWGASVNGVLAAYLRTYQVDGVRVIQQTRADTDYLKFYPMDALYFSILSAAAADSSCERIVNGSPLHRSLNHYKEQFLFRAVSLPYYSSHAGWIELYKRVSPTVKKVTNWHIKNNSSRAVAG